MIKPDPELVAETAKPEDAVAVPPGMSTTMSVKPLEMDPSKGPAWAFPKPTVPVPEEDAGAEEEHEEGKANGKASPAEVGGAPV